MRERERTLRMEARYELKSKRQDDVDNDRHHHPNSLQAFIKYTPRSYRRDITCCLLVRCLNVLVVVMLQSAG